MTTLNLNKALASRMNSIADIPLKIPISKRHPSDLDLLFESDSTRSLYLILIIDVYNNYFYNRNLIDNLWKSLHSNKDFSLKSCIRIRSCGTIRQNQQQKISLSRIATIRFEAILPDLSFSFQKINSIPILSTPMYEHILHHMNNKSYKSNSKNNQYLDDNNNFEIGYMTMNQTRKVICLSSKDPNLNQTPIIGIWLTISDNFDDYNNTDNLLEYPIIWASCIKYYHSTFVYKNQVENCVNDNNFVFIDKEKSTFLMVNLIF
jgi:hypothetical protein